jgi:SPW repeat-containing protein
MIASKRWQDWITTLIGALVALSPFVFTNSWNETEAWAAYIIGGLIFAVGVVSLLLRDAESLEVVKYVLTIALFCTPWLFGFVAVTGMAWTAWIGAAALFVVLATLLMQDRPSLVRKT